MTRTEMAKELVRMSKSLTASRGRRAGEVDVDGLIEKMIDIKVAIDKLKYNERVYLDDTGFSVKLLETVEEDIEIFIEENEGIERQFIPSIED